MYDSKKFTSHYFSNYMYDSENKIAFLYSDEDTVLHRHENFYEFTLVTYGCFINEYNGQRNNLIKNSLVYFCKGTQHSDKVASNNSMHFSFIIEENYFEEAFKRYFPNKSLSSLGMYKMQLLSDEDTNFLNDIASRLLENSSEESRNYLAHIFLFTAISLTLMSKDAIDIESSSNDIFVDLLIKQLNKYSYINRPLNTIYSEYPIAKSVLITSFKKRTGYTIVQYNTKKKMEWAAQRLNYAATSITELSVMLNYSSLSHFCKIFKKQYGIPPKQYQRLHTRYQLTDTDIY